MCHFCVAVPDVRLLPDRFSDEILRVYWNIHEYKEKREKFTEPFTFGQKARMHRNCCLHQKKPFHVRQSKSSSEDEALAVSDMPELVSCSLVVFDDSSTKPTILFSLVEPGQAWVWGGGLISSP